MADTIDKANETADLHLRVSLRNQRHGAKTAPVEGIGVCLHCAEPVEGERRFCGKDCADGYSKEQQRRG